MQARTDLNLLWMERWALPRFSLPPLASGFSVSLFAHVFLITGGLWWAGWSSPAQSGPAEFELVGLEAAYQSGINLPEKKASTPSVVSRSESDEAILPDIKKAQNLEKAAEAQTAQKASQGMGGTAAENIGTTADLWQQYGASVRQAILDGFRYPTASRSMGETGRVKIAFAILSDGSLTEVRIKNPSAYERLNEAAIAMITRLGKVAPLPKEDISRWDTEIAIDFTLN